MRWRNFNLALRIKLDSGAKIVISLVCMFIMAGLIHVSDKIEGNLTTFLLFIGAALGVGMVKDYKSQGQEIQAARDDLAEKLTKIKLASMGQDKPAEDPCPGAGKTGDPLT